MIEQVPLPPFEHPLNLTMQTVMTVGTWSLTLFLLIKAIRMAKAQQSLFPLIIILAGAVGSIAEPIYDIAYHLLWYIPGQWTLFTAFGLPQPVWVMSAYIVVFCGPALYIYEMIIKGMTTSQFYKLTALVFASTALFETIAINGGTYTYYGPQPLRIFNYPLWVAVDEAIFIMSFSLAAAHLRLRKTSEAQNFLLLAIFPGCFFMVNFGVGFPTLIALNSSAAPSMFVIYTGLLGSAVLGGLMLRWMATMLPRPRTSEAPAAAVTG